MFQASAPYNCTLTEHDWVMHMKVQQDKSLTVGNRGRTKILVALCHEVIIAIDPVSKVQMWSAQLVNSPMKKLSIGDTPPQQMNGEPGI